MNISFGYNSSVRQTIVRLTDQTQLVDNCCLARGTLDGCTDLSFDSQTPSDCPQMGQIRELSHLWANLLHF